MKKPEIWKLISEIIPVIHLRRAPVVGEVIEIQLETSTVLDDATKFEIHVKKPSSDIVSWPASQIDDRSIIAYTTKPDDLNVPGDYVMHAYVEWGDNKKLHGDKAVLTVLEEGAKNVAVLKVNELFT